MAEWLPAGLAGWRAPAAAAGLVLFVALETLLPFRQRVLPQWRHYLLNVTLTVGNAVLLRLVWGGLLVGAAAHATATGTGLLPALGVGPGWNVALTVLAFDALTYTLHVLYHYLPAMWRLHQVHHTDLDLDATSASRFHPGEILLSTVVQTAFALGIGARPEGVLLFQMLLLFQAQFQHSNVVLPGGVDRLARLLIVTPNMHRVHHSVIPAETNSNFATILSLWDRLGGTFRWGGRQEEIRIGLGAYPDPAQSTLPRLLAMPFRPVPADPLRHTEPPPAAPRRSPEGP